MNKDDIVYWEQFILYKVTKWAFALAFVFMVFYVVYQIGRMHGIKEGSRAQYVHDFLRIQDIEKDCVENNNLFITKPDTNGHST